MAAEMSQVTLPQAGSAETSAQIPALAQHEKSRSSRGATTIEEISQANDDQPPRSASQTSSQNGSTKAQGEIPDERPNVSLASRKKPGVAPWFHMPMTTAEADQALREHHSGSGWFREEQQASEWLNLFYDLAVVAVLGVFSTKHELSSAKILPGFVSYYLIIVWLWTSQTHYDVHYQSEDSFHRLTKYIQVVLFLYVGAASGQWDLSKIRNYTETPGIPSTVVSAHKGSAESFVTVSIALAISRLLLAIQYAVSAYIGRRRGRRVSHQIHTMLATCASTALTVIAVAIPAKTYAGVVLSIFFLYASLAVEMLVHIWHMWKVDRDGRRLDVEYLGRRWGAFTLVILGEGLTGLTKAFSYAIDGLNTNSGAVYGQVVLAVLIVVLLYAILFNRFRTEEDVSSRRFVWWEILHFGLHFGILLLLAAITNFVVILAFADGITDAYFKFIAYVGASIAGKDTSRWSHSHLVGFVDRLNIEPSLATEVRLLTDMAKNTSSTMDFEIVGVQYFAGIVFAALIQYNVEISDHTANLFLDLLKYNATISSNATLQSDRQDEVVDLLSEVINATVEEEYGGIIWLFPVAGGLLIMSAIRSLLWTTRFKSYNFKHVTSRLVHLIPLIVGTVLSLLGLLAIGSKHYDFRKDSFANPYYKLLDAGLPLAVVLIAYLLCHLGAETGLWWIARRKKRKQRAAARQSEPPEVKKRVE